MVQWRPREWMGLRSSSPGVGPPAVQEFQTERKEMPRKCRGLLWEPPQMKGCVVLVATLVWSRTQRWPW